MSDLFSNNDGLLFTSTFDEPFKFQLTQPSDGQNSFDSALSPEHDPLISVVSMDSIDFPLELCTSEADANMSQALNSLPSSPETPSPIAPTDFNPLSAIISSPHRPTTAAQPTSVPKVKLSAAETQDLIDFLQSGGTMADVTNDKGDLISKEKLNTGIERMRSLQNYKPPAPSPPPKKKLGVKNMPARYKTKAGKRKAAEAPIDDGSMSKQAVYARWYRQKNKEYIETLENKVDHMETENKDLRSTVDELKQAVLDLKTETSYLRGLLANSEAIGPLLSQLGGSKAGLKVQMSGCKRAFEDDDEPPPHVKRVKANDPDAPGVCLHVKDGKVSVELCGRCNGQSR